MAIVRPNIKSPPFGKLEANISAVLPVMTGKVRGGDRIQQSGGTKRHAQQKTPLLVQPLSKATGCMSAARDCVPCKLIPHRHPAAQRARHCSSPIGWAAAGDPIEYF